MHGSYVANFFFTVALILLGLGAAKFFYETQDAETAVIFFIVFAAIAWAVIYGHWLILIIGVIAVIVIFLWTTR
ncbi:MAG: hypothetical protein ACM3UU_05205 [Ignavibacteriales bacterium]